MRGERTSSNTSSQVTCNPPRDALSPAPLALLAADPAKIVMMTLESIGGIAAG